MRRRQRPASSPAATAGRFVIDLQRDGVLEAARQVESPNWDARPPAVVPELIVVHGISLPPGEYGGTWIDLLFTNALPRDAHPYFATVADLRVSSHLLIRRDGEPVQYVPFGRRAWHAGVSSWQGRERCNDYSIGIELEGADDDPYESAQYAMLGRVIALLCRAYPSLAPERVVGHSDVAPGRKTDPGLAFDWPRLHALVRFELDLMGGGPSSAPA
jgi:N-acetyl-anhydromuramoyl-L-alanine amidase